MTATVHLTPDGGAVVDDMPHDEYLRHPALSASGAKLLVQPGGPARYRHRLEHPEPPSDRFDLGHAAHAAVLGVGPTIVEVHASDWRSARAREQRDAIRANGGVPMLSADMDRVQGMAAALREHPVASRVLHPDSGRPEVSLFWHDAAHDVDRRGRVDYLRHPDDTGRLILADYKTCAAADPRSIAAAVARYRYHMQAAWYRDLVIGLGLARTCPFLFVFQETTAPYLVHVVELDEQLLAMGADLNARALDLFARCTADDRWPGYNDGGISTVSAPTWALYEHDDLVAGDA